MVKSYQINLLIPYLDGEFYGTIFKTLHQEATKRQAKLLTIQSFASVENPGVYDCGIGLESADGWLLATGPILPSSSAFLKAIEASGKPIITISYKEDSIVSHSVVVDNRSAIKEAVLHLIEVHGHRKIAFVGSTDHYDLIERFEGYKEALRESEIEYKAELYFNTESSLRQGGVTAAREMLERGIDFTAVIAATDLNALGVMEGLQAVGYHIPNDIALIGFDDIDSSATFTPPLTTIHQPIADLASSSIELLFRQMEGEQFQQNISYVPTKFQPRSSCGCLYQPKDEPIEMMQKNLVTTEANVAHLIKSHNQLAANWASASREEYFDLGKMFRGISHWGCLALWEKNSDGHKHLIIEQVFGKPGDPVPPLGEKVSIEQFPPIQWLPEITGDEYLRVQAIRSDQEDLGFIVLVGPVDQLVLVSEVDITRISCNISVTALVRDRLYNQVQSIAEKLQIVSKMTNDGIWDWDIEADQIQWSTRAHDMISSIGETLTSDPNSFLQLIHPDEYDKVHTEIKEHIKNGTPLKMEFRIQSRKNNKELWLFFAGDSIQGQNGEKIRMIGSLNNITDKKKAEKQITHLAYHDVLTGLANRRLFRDRFYQYKSNADRHSTMLGIIIIDLDRFKIINDTLGHNAGDELLQEVANMLERVAQRYAPIGQTRYDNAMVARMGGDEFVILLANIQELSQIQYVVDQMIDHFQKPFMIENLEIFTTASMGISIYPSDGTDIDELSRCADIAMYKAKEQGKNQSVMYNTAINSSTYERLTMENGLRKALERDEFVLHYQPQFDVETHTVFGVEALIRWNSPERGLVSPNDFIPLAEDSGMIIPIGQWVLREACLQKKVWDNQGTPAPVISVNISAIQLLQNDFVDMVRQTLMETGLPADSLCLEITESTAIMNWNNSIEKLQKLTELGIQISIDDFGTGYSSLSMLKHFPIRNVKIDRSFVQDMVVNPDDAAIATAIISLAHRLGMNVIAEGVETEAQKQLLLDAYCNYIQGYIYSKPLTAEEFLKFVNDLPGEHT